MVLSRQSGAPSRDRSRDEKKKASRKPSSTGGREMTDFAFSTARRRRLWFFENLRQKKKNRKKARPKSHGGFPANSIGCRERGSAERASVARGGAETAKTTVQRRATKGPPGISRVFWRASVWNLRGVCRGARASPPYLPGMPREMTAHLLPYTACAARIFLSSSSVNGPRFTEGLSWLHHLRGRNNEIRNNESGWLERQRDARGRGGSARVAVEDQARKRASRAMRGRRTRARRARGDSRGVARPRTRSGARAP
jgi:hypothetical protein